MPLLSYCFAHSFRHGHKYVYITYTNAIIKNGNAALLVRLHSVHADIFKCWKRVER